METDIDLMLNNGESCQEIVMELRKATGMKRKEFSEYFQIPYRTVQEWELGHRVMPDYVLRMMAYQLKAEGMLDSKQ